MRRFAPFCVLVALLGLGLPLACSSGGQSGSEHQTPGGPGDFSSVWQADSAQIQSTSGGLPQSYKVPATLHDNNVGLDLEYFVAFDDTHVIHYAHYQGESLYYSIRETATHTGAAYVTKTAQFFLQNGSLTELNSLSTVVTTTVYRVASFPPSSWPTTVIKYEASP